MIWFVVMGVSAQQREAIAPMVRTQWGQGSPYNLLCPTQGGQHCQTGCVATAMAQVMKYHEWPKQGFDWQNMLNIYDCETTEQERMAVAQLVAQCGAAVNMEYGLQTSAAWEGDAAIALVETYGYAQTVREVFRNMYGRTAWENIVYHELQQGRPVFYGGLPSGFTHQFVCDGYADGKFHFNMAWQYLPDGYYTVNDLDKYPEGQTAIIGIQPTCDEDFCTTFSEGSLRYTVTDVGEVTVCKDEKNIPTGDLIIPATVTHEGKTYQVTAIDYTAFEDCTSLTSLSIPASVTVIGHRCVQGCTQLSNINVDSNNPWYTAKQGVVVAENSYFSELIAYPAGKTSTFFRVPAGVTSIPPSFFRDNTYLQRVELPSSVVVVDLLAFRGCTALTTIVTENVSPRAIEDLAFDEETYAHATLIVPVGTKNTYKRLAGWKNFKHIEEGTATDIHALSEGMESSAHPDFSDKSYSYRLDGTLTTEVQGIVIDAVSRRKYYENIR